MELAEGRLCTSTREKSTDNFQKKISQKEKPEIKESLTVEPKRPIAEESLQTLHTESDLSDISDDPDDILNMEEDTTVCIFINFFMIKDIYEVNFTDRIWKLVKHEQIKRYQRLHIVIRN